jgi:flagellar protein FliO/FliZ
MMGDTILRLILLIPVIGAMAWGSLWLWKRVQTGLPARSRPKRAAQLVDVISMGSAGKLAVIDFRGQELLIAVSRGQISLIAAEDGTHFHA